MNALPRMKAASYEPGDFAAIEPLLPRPDPKLRAPPDFPFERPIPVSETRLDGREGEYLAQCIARNWISSTGSFVTDFEKAFAARAGCGHGIACSSGTTALHLALAAMGLGPGDEVVVPAFTMIAVPNAVAFTGARPVFADIEPRTGNLDPAAAEAALTPHSRAIVAAQTYGHPADMEALAALARRRGLAFIEDAAEAHGARLGGRPAGSLGDAGAFSFYGNKIISTGEGGMITTDDAGYAALARRLRDHAFSPVRHFWHEYRGFNYRMTNLQAAVGLAQTERFDELVDIRRRNGLAYRARLAGAPGLRVPDPLPGVEPVYWMNVVLVDAPRFGCDRDAARAHLAARGVETRTAFIPLHLQPIYRAAWRGRSFPVSEDWGRRGLLLPSGPWLTEAQIDYVCRALLDAPRAAREPGRGA